MSCQGDLRTIPLGFGSRARQADFSSCSEKQPSVCVKHYRGTEGEWKLFSDSSAALCMRECGRGTL